MHVSRPQEIVWLQTPTLTNQTRVNLTYQILIWDHRVPTELVWLHNPDPVGRGGRGYATRLLPSKY